LDVQAKSAADRAGVRRHDVLHKLDDQLLVNPEQFAVLVRTHSPGDSVKVTVIRKAKSRVLSVKLGSRRLSEDHVRIERLFRGFPGPWRGPGRLLPPSRLRQLPEDWGERIGDGLRRHLKPWPKPPHRSPPKAKPKAGKPKVAKPKVAPSTPKSTRRTKFVLKTPKYTITVTGADGVQKATIQDSKGKVLHKDVPSEKWKDLPEEVRRLLEGVKLKTTETGLRVTI
ncbi:hypothetical protein LCGC14_2869730, partial [marine sediment metagenome]